VTHVVALPFADGRVLRPAPADDPSPLVATAEGDPSAAARQVLAAAGCDPDRLDVLGVGEPLDLGGDGPAVPVLVAAPRDADASGEWVDPAGCRREGPAWLWAAYDHVRPCAETVAADTTHGAETLSVLALTALRDEAALAVDRDDGGLRATARELRTARPAMPAVANRVNRAMAASDGTPAGVAEGATAGIERARRVAARAATRAASLVGGRVATLSRSGTVRRALADAAPEAVLVAESRPGREGVGVAENLAERTAVTLTTDAALAYELAAWDAETLLVGADTVFADGRVLNKVGTRGAALAAAREGIDALAVATGDKVHPYPAAEPDLEERDATELYDGQASVGVANPTFDVTPADSVRVVTEAGPQDPSELAAVAATHRERAAWDE
jgi:translation initiation factor 2B subunit (eIF-2B alpha/beta/delta family)